MDIKQELLTRKPNLSASSLKAYNSTLTNLHRNVFGNDDYSLDNFNNIDVINDYLKDVPVNKRKTIYATLVSLTNNQLYRDRMLEDNENHNQIVETQTKTEAQQENWAEPQTIQSTFDKLRNESKLLFKKENKTIDDLQKIQNFIIVALTSGIYIPPRRAMDYTEFRIKNINPDEDNYMNRKTFVFNRYKTAKSYGRQVVDIPVQLKNLITKWMTVNPTDYLLFDSNMNKMTNVKLNQRMNKIFNGKIAINAMRHSYLTDKYGTTSSEMNDLAEDMTMMGSSILQQKEYIKLK